MENIELEIETLKRMIHEFFFIKPLCYTEKELKFYQEQILSILYDLGYGKRVDYTLLENIIENKEDENIKRSLSRKLHKNETKGFSSKYYAYLKDPHLKVEDVKYLITRYFVNLKNPSFKKEELEELRRIIPILLRRLGYPQVDITHQSFNECLRLIEEKPKR